MGGASTASRAASSSGRGFEAALRRMRPLAGTGAAVRAGCRLSSRKAADVAPHNTSSDIRCTPRHRAYGAGAPHGPVAHCEAGRVARTTPVTRRGTGSVFLGRPPQRLASYADAPASRSACRRLPHFDGGILFHAYQRDARAQKGDPSGKRNGHERHDEHADADDVIRPGQRGQDHS